MIVEASVFFKGLLHSYQMRMWAYLKRREIWSYNGRVAWLLHFERTITDHQGQRERERNLKTATAAFHSAPLALSKALSSWVGVQLIRQNSNLVQNCWIHHSQCDFYKIQNNCDSCPWRIVHKSGKQLRFKVMGGLISHGVGGEWETRKKVLCCFLPAKLYPVVPPLFLSAHCSIPWYTRI